MDDNQPVKSAHIEYLEGAVDAARAKLLIEGQEEGLLEEAQIYEAALLQLFIESKNIGQAILGALWHVHLNGLIQFLGYDVESDLEAWAIDKFAEHADPKYIGKLVQVVEVVLQDVFVHESSGHPYLDDVGLPITVQGLIEKYGLVNKLTAISFAYSLETTTPKQKAELLSAVQNSPRKDVEAKRDEVLNKPIKVKLKYRAVTSPDGRLNIVFSGIDGDQFHVLRALLGDAAEEVFS